MTTNGAEKRDYVLGHSESELQRLIMQARFFGDLTREVLLRAGVTSGMRILDAGCGAGDVSFLAASIVGPSGSVHGVDKSPDAIALATQRASSANLTNVTFEVGELANYESAAKFDAVIGRLVLMYFPDPAAALRSLSRSVKPGGLILFHEVDLSTARSAPKLPLFESHLETIRETLRRGGVTVNMGSALHRAFRAAGLGDPEMIGHARVEGRATSDAYEQLAGIARALLPLIELFGVSSAKSLDLDTFADRLRADVLAHEAVIVAPLLIGAWAKVP